MYPIFSGSDIRAIHILQQANKIVDINTFTLGVVTASGTNYLLKISDPAKFATFANANLNTVADFQQFESTYDNNRQAYKIAGNNDLTSFELGLLATLDNSGLTVLKGNSSFSGYNTLSKSSGGSMVTHKISLIICN